MPDEYDEFQLSAGIMQNSAIGSGQLSQEKGLIMMIHPHLRNARII